MKTFVVAMRKVYTACIYEGKRQVTLLKSSILNFEFRAPQQRARPGSPLSSLRCFLSFPLNS